ncbi:MAG: 6-pyruvoyl trahydropterin synthase family protein [Candidatus Hodarchaeales archaeon]|jgi:6-pyruvoyltetrahydropterin/6-carboxytetrahydropterin synthase
MRELSLELKKASFCFSAAHFLIGFGKCERLHGHNYQVHLKVTAEFHPYQEAIIDFSLLKSKVSEIISKLDHRILLAKKHPRMNILLENEQVTVDERRYTFPKTDVILLPIPATTCEHLACHLLDKIKEAYPEFKVEITLEETPGSRAVVSNQS